eukprot:TRINITY_DN26691_c0_g1_i1.p4 TRINITY_DN26691_c0_g1~~TRINITY_DN26691_c0_g1_i1.p4  ORF type:complete len:104 (-),score=9.87 TRINITY_DN26691_c0_g1_i1:651-962(-)
MKGTCLLREEAAQLQEGGGLVPPRCSRHRTLQESGFDAVDYTAPIQLRHPGIEGIPAGEGYWGWRTSPSSAVTLPATTLRVVAENDVRRATEGHEVLNFPHKP